MLEKLETLLGTWSKQIEQVLAESEQMRREADDIGPTAELDYWKSRTAKFNKYVINKVLVTKWSKVSTCEKVYQFAD